MILRVADDECQTNLRWSPFCIPDEYLSEVSSGEVSSGEVSSRPPPLSPTFSSINNEINDYASENRGSGEFV